MKRMRGVIFWMGDHWLGITVAGVLSAAVVAVGLWWVWRALARGLMGGGGGGGKRRYKSKGNWSWPWMKFRSGKYERVDRHEV